jgi:large subunit ribosomal protein L3
MAIGLVGRKAGMTRVFTEDGASIPVTLIEVEPNRVTQVKTEDIDGYRALQVTVGSRRASRVTKPMAGHFAKAGVAPGRNLWEFRLADGEGSEIVVGAELNVDLFQGGPESGRDRHDYRQGLSRALSSATTSAGSAPPTVTRCRIAPPARSVRIRALGECSRARKWRVTLGAAQRCTQNLEVIRVDAAAQYLLAIKGAVPGAKGGDVMVRPAVKARR